MSAQQQSNLPGPRIWKPEDLMEYLHVSKSWIYQRTSPKAENPIPRLPGVGKLLFDTHSPAFREWLRDVVGVVDNEASHE